MSPDLVAYHLRLALLTQERSCDECKGSLGWDDVHQGPAEEPGQQVIEVRCPHCRAVLFSHRCPSEERAA